MSWNPMTGSRKAGATYLRAIAEHGLKFPVARGRLNTYNSSSFQGLKRLNTRDPKNSGYAKRLLELARSNWGAQTIQGDACRGIAY